MCEIHRVAHAIRAVQREWVHLDDARAVRTVLEDALARLPSSENDAPPPIYATMWSAPQCQPRKRTRSGAHKDGATYVGTDHASGIPELGFVQLMDCLCNKILFFLQTKVKEWSHLSHVLQHAMRDLEFLCDVYLMRIVYEYIAVQHSATSILLLGPGLLPLVMAREHHGHGHGHATTLLQCHTDDGEYQTVRSAMKVSWMARLARRSGPFHAIIDTVGTTIPANRLPTLAPGGLFVCWKRCMQHPPTSALGGIVNQWVTACGSGQCFRIRHHAVVGNNTQNKQPVLSVEDVDDVEVGPSHHPYSLTLEKIKTLSPGREISQAILELYLEKVLRPTPGKHLCSLLSTNAPDRQVKRALEHAHGVNAVQTLIPILHAGHYILLVVQSDTAMGYMANSLGNHHDARVPENIRVHIHTNRSRGGTECHHRLWGPLEWSNPCCFDVKQL